jgi:hypothetical protein
MRKLTTKHRRWTMDVMPKGEFIRTYGRDAYMALPTDMVIKFGRREFIASIAVFGRSWERPPHWQINAHLYAPQT